VVCGRKLIAGRLRSIYYTLANASNSTVKTDGGVDVNCCNEPRHIQKMWREKGLRRKFVICRTCGSFERMKHEITSWEQAKINNLKQWVDYLLNRLKVYQSQNQKQKPPLPTQLLINLPQVTHKEAA